MAYKRLSRKDYQNLIGIANEKNHQMISNDNRNRSQRDAMIDTMNKSQVRRMGKLVDFF